MTPLQIVPADTPERLAAARELFLDYAASLNFDLCFQNFNEELAGLPGAYAPPAGRLLLAELNGEPAGCVALRPLGDGVCELKRLYVRPLARGQGLGRSLVEAALAEARGIGYREVRLDTVPAMREAQALYEALGFTDVVPYTANPVPGARYMAKTL